MIFDDFMLMFVTLLIIRFSKNHAADINSVATVRAGLVSAPRASGPWFTFT
jgi:hypothetical protein